MLGGKIEAVADENERRVGDGTGRDVRAEGDVLGEVERGAVAEGDGGFIGVDGDLIERHGLEVAVACPRA